MGLEWDGTVSDRTRANGPGNHAPPELAAQARDAIYDIVNASQ